VSDGKGIEVEVTVAILVAVWVGVGRSVLVAWMVTVAVRLGAAVGFGAQLERKRLARMIKLGIEDNIFDFLMKKLLFSEEGLEYR
jgi:hypothetical protein